MDKIPDKFHLGKKVEFDDGYLEVYVGRGHAHIEWKPKKEAGHYELITWVIMGSNRPIPMRPCVSVKDKDNNPLNSNPESIMRYRSLFEGINKDIDRLLNLYDKDFVIRNPGELEELADGLGFEENYPESSR